MLHRITNRKIHIFVEIYGDVPAAICCMNLNLFYIDLITNVMLVLCVFFCFLFNHLNNSVFDLNKYPWRGFHIEVQLNRNSNIKENNLIIKLCSTLINKMKELQSIFKAANGNPFFLVQNIFRTTKPTTKFN